MFQVHFTNNLESQTYFRIIIASRATDSFNTIKRVGSQQNIVST